MGSFVNKKVDLLRRAYSVLGRMKKTDVANQTNILGSKFCLDLNLTPGGVFSLSEE